MNSLPVRFSHHPQIFADLRNESPSTNATIELNLFSYRILQDISKPLGLQVRTPRHDTRPKVGRRLHVCQPRKFLLFHRCRSGLLSVRIVMPPSRAAMYTQFPADTTTHQFYSVGISSAVIHVHSPAPRRGLLLNLQTCRRA